MFGTRNLEQLFFQERYVFLYARFWTGALAVWSSIKVCI
jgi:hypothetical protein